MSRFSNQVVEGNMLNTAILVDAENVSTKELNLFFRFLRRWDAKGRVVVKRAYGDFGKTISKKVPELHTMGLDCRHTPPSTGGKNAADFVLTIDAIEMLYNSNVDQFVIVSSDAGFSVLASRLQEAGKSVFCFSRQKHSAHKVFDKFFVFEEIFAKKEISQVDHNAASLPNEVVKPIFRYANWWVAERFIDLVQSEIDSRGGDLRLKGLSRMLNEVDGDLCSKLEQNVNTVIQSNPNLFTQTWGEGKRYIGINQTYLDALRARHES